MDGDAINSPPQGKYTDLCALSSRGLVAMDGRGKIKWNQAGTLFVVGPYRSKAFWTSDNIVYLPL